MGQFGGNGGDLDVTLRGDFDIVYVSTKGVGGQQADGKSGDIQVVVAGTIGSMMAESGDDFDGRKGGNVRVILQDGAVVNGTVFANQQSDSDLIFQLSIGQRSEFDNASHAIRVAASAGGTISINGQTYNWEGFDDLVNMLNYVGPVRSSDPTSSAEVVIDYHRSPQASINEARLLQLAQAAVGPADRYFEAGCLRCSNLFW